MCVCVHCSFIDDSIHCLHLFSVHINVFVLVLNCALYAIKYTVEIGLDWVCSLIENVIGH